MNTMRLSFVWARSIAVLLLTAAAVPLLARGNKKQELSQSTFLTYYPDSSYELYLKYSPKARVELEEEFSYLYGIYLSAYAVRREHLIKELIKSADEGCLNAVVVDMKDDFGYLRYPSSNQIAKKIGAIRPIFQLDSFLTRMHSHNIKVIARIVCFKDERAASYSKFGVRRSGGGLWADGGGAHWMNAFEEETWGYLASVAAELERLEFDEIQLDYVRFPTDGDVFSCIFHSRKGRIKEEAIEGFLKVVKDSVSIPLSVDVFGYAAWRTLKLEGQELARIAKHVDYVCPMLYPSHFSTSFLKKYPYRDYWVYQSSVASAYRLMGNEPTGVVAYIQGFSWRAKNFGAHYILEQMSGAAGAGAQGFIVWNASGKYAPTFKAFRMAQNLLKRTDIPSFQEIRKINIPPPVLYEMPPIPRTRNPIRNLFLPIRLGGSRNGNRRGQ